MDEATCVKDIVDVLRVICVFIKNPCLGVVTALANAFRHSLHRCTAYDLHCGVEALVAAEYEMAADEVSGCVDAVIIELSNFRTRTLIETFLHLTILDPSNHVRL